MSEKTIIKNSSSMGELVIKKINYYVAKEIIVKNHYSKKWNTSFGVYNFGIFKNGKLLGVAVYGNLMNPDSYKKWSDNLKQDEVVELNRMWIDDTLGHNAESILISSTIKYFKMYIPKIRLIQTFADGRLGCGTIYKASNFNYYGYTETLFFKDKKTNIVYHKVPIENTKRPKGFIKLNRLFLDNRLIPFIVKTYKYAYIVDKRLRKKIAPVKEKYPEYEKGFEILENYKHSKGILARIYLMFKAINDNEYAQKTKKYYQKHYDFFEQEIKNQKQNDSYIWFMNEYDKVDLIIKSRTIFDY